MNLEENFIKYKDITLTIIEIVKKEEYEKLDEIFKQRQLILNNINNIDCSKEELKKLYLQYNIANLDKTLELKMKAKKECVLKKLRESQKRKAAMNVYNNLRAKAVFLTKEF